MKQARNSAIAGSPRIQGAQHIFMGVPVVQNGRQPQICGEIELLAKGGPLNVARRQVPVVIQTDLAYRHHSRVAR